MVRIGIVSNNIYANKIFEDLRLKNELLKLNIQADIISWEDPTINYDRYRFLMLRSVWGYQNRYSDFKKWFSFLQERGIKIYNSVDIVMNNIRKDIQFKILSNNNIPHVPTIFKKEKSDLIPITCNMVVKPIISGSGENTFRGSKVNLNVYDSIFEEQDNGIMIQPYMKDIENGEYSVIFIDKENTHTMLRYPGVFTEKKRPCQIFDVPIRVMQLANKVSSIKEYSDALYMRVDIVGTHDPVVMEVELAEPDLLIKYITDVNIQNAVVRKLAKSVERRM